MLNIKSLIRSLYIPGTLKGCVYLTCAVKIGVADENKLFCVSKLIFADIAKEYNTTVTCVEKNIRTAINICWNGDGREKLIGICGRTLTKKPTVSEMIDILVEYVGRHR